MMCKLKIPERTMKKNKWCKCLYEFDYQWYAYKDYDGPIVSETYSWILKMTLLSHSLVSLVVVVPSLLRIEESWFCLLNVLVDFVEFDLMGSTSLDWHQQWAMVETGTRHRICRKVDTEPIYEDKIKLKIFIRKCIRIQWWLIN